jgi:flagellum-specific peptidoglycan hydrolase FlgJ
MIRLFVILLLLPMGLWSQKTTEAYIQKWKAECLQQMEQYGIPASITMAQGILESGAGTSDLATAANNHFGIKCHKDWTGKKFYKDDDQKDECFRVYEHAEASFEDHSLFLKRDRYASLFELKPTDYKGWAQGLKQCGYATNPKYPQLLIELIEKHRLHELDQGSEAVSQLDDLKKKLAELY